MREQKKFISIHISTLKRAICNWLVFLFLHLNWNSASRKQNFSSAFKKNHKWCYQSRLTKIVSPNTNPQGNRKKKLYVDNGIRRRQDDTQGQTKKTIPRGATNHQKSKQGKSKQWENKNKIKKPSRARIAANNPILIYLIFCCRCNIYAPFLHLSANWMYIDPLFDLETA